MTNQTAASRDLTRCKANAALKALEFIPYDCVLGVGTGSTVKFLIDNLSKVRDKIKMTVASSNETAALLKKYEFFVEELNIAGKLDLYIDGADQYNKLKQLVKGGGGAHTREKILATAAEKFICIVDANKPQGILGTVPIPVETLPMARSFVAHEIIKLGGYPQYRENFITDNNNIILDIYNLKIYEPIKMEEKLNNIPGVVGHGLFAVRSADSIIIGHKDKVDIL